MSFRVRFTLEAKHDHERLLGFLADRDPVAAAKALAIIERSWFVPEEFQFSCRKAAAGNPLLRERVISFEKAGYVALFEIEDNQTVTVLAVRHQREDDYN